MFCRGKGSQERGCKHLKHLVGTVMEEQVVEIERCSLFCKQPEHPAVLSAPFLRVCLATSGQ